jgi:tetratricopeptide (TPR) repeat protein
MSHTYFFTGGFLALVVWMLLSGCSSSSNDEAIAQSRAQAQTLVAKQQYSEALRAYQRVAQLNPADADAYYQMARLYLRLGKPDDVQQAHQALLKVVKLNKSHIDAHRQLARLYLAAEQFKQAELHANAILAADPNHAEGHTLLGISHIGDQRIKAGQAELRKAIESDPQSLSAYLELARTYVRERDFPAAEKVLRDSLEIDARSVDVRTALGDVLAAAGRESEAEEEYRLGLEQDQTQGVLYLRLAGLNQKQRRLTDAEGWYQRWITAVPNDARAHVAIAQFYWDIGRTPEAEASLHRARKGDPSSPFAHEALASLYLKSNRLTEAGQEIERLLQSNATAIAGRLLQAQLTLRRGDPEKAVLLLQDIVRQAPKLAAAHHYLGMAWAQQNKWPDAISALKQARTLAPTSSEIRTTLSRTYLAQGSLGPAITEGEAAVAADPQNVSALALLADAHLLDGDTKRAQQRLKELLTLLPNDLSVHHRLGVVTHALHREDEAIAHFEQALKMKPDFVEPLEQIVVIMATQGKVVQARERLVRHIAAHPQEPRFYNVLGRMLMQAKQFREAEAAFQKALGLDETLLETYAYLGMLYAHEGKVKKAIEKFEAIVAKSPQQVSALMILGLLYEQQEDYTRARANYEATLRINAQFAPAANNLAWLLVEHLEDGEHALSYAETARRIAPTDPYIADTLGWIYYRKQLYAKSASLLKEAVDRLPTHPLVLYHYGMVQYANKERDQAKQALDKFLTVAPDDPHAQEAKEVLAKLT